MIVVSNKELEERLDKAWNDFLNVCQMLSIDSLNQLQNDQEAVRRFENMVSNLNAAATSHGPRVNCAVTPPGVVAPPPKRDKKSKRK